MRLASKIDARKAAAQGTRRRASSILSPKNGGGALVGADAEHYLAYAGNGIGEDSSVTEPLVCVCVCVRACV